MFRERCSCGVSHDSENGTNKEVFAPKGNVPSIGVLDVSSYMSTSFISSIWNNLTISRLTYRESGIIVLKRMMNDTRIGKKATPAFVRYLNNVRSG